MSSATTSQGSVLGLLAVGLVGTGAVATDAGFLSAATEDEAAVLEPAESIRVGFVVDARNLEAGKAVIESRRFRTTAVESDGGRDSSSNADFSGNTDASAASPSPAVEVVEPDAKTRTVTVSDGRGRTVPTALGSLRGSKGVILEGVVIQFGDIEDATLEVRVDRGRQKGDGCTYPRPAPTAPTALPNRPAPPTAAPVHHSSRSSEFWRSSLRSGDGGIMTLSRRFWVDGDAETCSHPDSWIVAKQVTNPNRQIKRHNWLRCTR